MPHVSRIAQFIRTPMKCVRYVIYNIYPNILGIFWVLALEAVISSQVIAEYFQPRAPNVQCAPMRYRDPQTSRAGCLEERVGDLSAGERCGPDTARGYKKGAVGPPFCSGCGLAIERGTSHICRFL